MALGHGWNSWIGVAEEVTFGTPVTATGFVEVENESIRREVRPNVVPLLGHVSQRRTVPSKVNVSGSFRFPLLWDGITGTLLKHAMGSVNTTGPSGGLYTHTLSLAASLPTGLTLEAARDDAAVTGNASYQYAGCKISKLTLTQEMEQPLMVDVEILGKTRALIAATSKTFPTYDAAYYGQMTVASIDPGGGSAYSIPLKSFKLMIDNNLFDDGYRLGSAERAFISRAGQRKITLELEAEYENRTFIDLFTGTSLDNLRFTWVNSTKSLQIDLPSVTFDGDEPTSEDQGPIYLSVKNTALANSADSDEMTAVLINATSAL